MVNFIGFNQIEAKTSFIIGKRFLIIQFEDRWIPYNGPPFDELVRKICLCSHFTFGELYKVKFIVTL